MIKFASCLVAILMAAPAAFGQIDTFHLRSKYGSPLDRETFSVHPGIEMVVDYGPAKQVCRIQLPSGMQIVGDVPPGAITKQQTDEVLNEVVPPFLRGKELGRMATAAGAIMMFSTDYEHVTISEIKNSAVGTGITVTFKDPTCPKKTAP
jgi:hypothetical protein